MERVGRPKTSYKQCAEQGSRTVQVGLRLLYIPPLSLLLLLLFLFLLAGPLRLQVLVDALQRPVKHVVHVVPLPNEELSEEPFQVAVVRLVLEAQASGVVEVRGKLRGKALAQRLHGRLSACARICESTFPASCALSGPATAVSHARNTSGCSRCPPGRRDGSAQCQDAC
ncbi:putative DNA-directed RNA polymerase subunit [Trypanosoma cruzi]|uniref:Putative DNA-directed RNA polymerase subunit n=1 Tax=Trypanosoma cruzi TaxID=5693 RepID=A0A2V2WUU6_TRYCR|nr:putative DNA-directed RNA polymerase subunit [Trypanosoma cruzi]